MDLADSPVGTVGSIGCCVPAARVADGTAAATAAASRRIRNLRAVLEATGGVVPSLSWLQHASDAALTPASIQDQRGSDGRDDVSEEDADAVFAQVLHHDLRCVVDRTRPSPAALRLRDEISRSRAAPSGGQQGGASPAVARLGAESQDCQGERGDRSTPCRLLVQLEEVVNVALSNEARMQRDVHNDPATNAKSSLSSSLPPPPGSRCLKLLLVDGYQNPLQPRENPSSNNHQASSLTNGVIVAMEISPIPNLTDHTVAGTKLLLTFGDEEGVSTTNCSSTGTPRVSHGVLLLTPQNCLVVGGLVPELASEQARQRKAFQDQSGASITDPTIRALVSHNYMADANADDDEADEREGESGDVANNPGRSGVRTPVPAPVAAPHPVTLTLPRTPGMITSSTGSAPAPQSTATSSFDGTQSSVLRTGPETTARVTMAPPPTSTSSFNAPVSSTSDRDGSVFGSGNVPAARATVAVNPYAARPLAQSSSPPPQRDHDHQTFYNGGPTTSAPSSTVAASPGAGSIGAFSVPSSATGTTRTTSTSSLCDSAVHAMPPPPARASSSTYSSPPVQPMPFDELYELLHRAMRQRSTYEQLYTQTLYVRMVQVTPKLHFNIEKIPRQLRLDSADEKSSQRKHEYVLIARFRGDVHAEQSDARSITCKLSNRVLEPFFVHPADDLRQMKKTERARVDELVLQGGRKLQNWTVQEQLYRVKLLSSPDEYFAILPLPALDNDTVPLLTLDAP